MRRARAAPAADAAFEYEFGDDQSVQDEIPPAPRRRGRGRGRGRVSNMGSLFTISYWVQPKPGIDTKAFLDELRTRNGNLNVMLENPDDQLVPLL